MSTPARPQGPGPVKASLLAPGDTFVSPSTGEVGWTVAGYPQPAAYGLVNVAVRLPDGKSGNKSWPAAAMVNSINPKN